MCSTPPAPSENALLSKSISPTATAPPMLADATTSFMSNALRNATSFGTAPSAVVSKATTTTRGSDLESGRVSASLARSPTSACAAKPSATHSAPRPA